MTTRCASAVMIIFVVVPGCLRLNSFLSSLYTDCFSAEYGGDGKFKSFMYFFVVTIPYPFFYMCIVTYLYYRQH